MRECENLLMRKLGWMIFGRRYKVLVSDFTGLIADQLNNVEEIDEEDENAEVERANAKEEKEIMEVLIGILGDGKAKEDGDIPANGTS